MKKLKELVSDTLIYGISSVVARFVTYLLVPFYTDIFDPAEYGIIGLIYSAIALLNVVFTFGMESAYLRYAADRERAKDIFTTVQLVLLGVSTFLSVLILKLNPVAMPILGLAGDTEVLYYYMIGILWFDTLSIIPFAELRLVRKTWLFAGTRLANVIINLSLNFYLILGLGFGLEAVLISQLAASATTTLFLAAYTSPMLFGRFDSKILDKALLFGVPFIPAGIGYTINEFIDRFFLNAMSSQEVTALYGAGMTSEAVTGIYNACYKLAVFMLLLIQMFRMAWQPFFMRHANDEGAKELFRTVFRGFNVVAATAFIVVALFAPEIAAIPVPVLDTTIIDSRYWQGLSIVPVILMAYWFQGWYVNFTAGIFIMEKTKYLPQVTLGGAVITIIANFALVPFFGMMGSATATLLSYSAMAIALFVISTRIYPVSYEMGRSLLTVTISGLAVLGLFLFADGLQTPFAIKLGVLGIVLIFTFIIGVTGLDLSKRLGRS